MKTIRLLTLATLALGLMAGTIAKAQEPAEMHVPAPELQGIEEWLNTKPLQLKDLKGKVVVLHFWTFG
jgi:hypothetical protein